MDSKSITTTFDTLGTFFVDIFYNDIYNKSRSVFESARAASITEAYKHMSMSYINILSSNVAIYKQIITALFEYFKKHYSNPGMSFAAFIDRIILAFFPPEYKNTLSDNNKDTLLREVVVNGLTEFIKFLLSPDILSRVIDDHKNCNNVKILQDRFVTIFSAHRESYYSRIVEKLRGGNDANKVPATIYEDLKQKMVDEVRKRVAVERELNNARKLIQQLTDQIDILRQATVVSRPGVRPIKASEPSTLPIKIEPALAKTPYQFAMEPEPEPYEILEFPTPASDDDTLLELAPIDQD